MTSNWQTLPETPGPPKKTPKNSSQLQRAQHIHESLCIHGTTPTDFLTLRLALHGCLHIGALPRQMVFTQQKVQLERNPEKRKSECANGARVHSYVLFPRIIKSYSFNQNIMTFFQDSIQFKGIYIYIDIYIEIDIDSITIIGDRDPRAFPGHWED